jgi:hypothetical protein
MCSLQQLLVVLALRSHRVGDVVFTLDRVVRRWHVLLRVLFWRVLLFTFLGCLRKYLPSTQSVLPLAGYLLLLPGGSTSPWLFSAVLIVASLDQINAGEVEISQFLLALSDELLRYLETKGGVDIAKAYFFL